MFRRSRIVDVYLMLSRLPARHHAVKTISSGYTHRGISKTRGLFDHWNYFGVSDVSGHTVLITIHTVKSRATADVTTGIAAE